MHSFQNSSLYFTSLNSSLPASAMNVDRFEKGPREILNPEIQKVPIYTTCQSILAWTSLLFLVCFVFFFIITFTSTITGMLVLQPARLLLKCVVLIKRHCRLHVDIWMHVHDVCKPCTTYRNIWKFNLVGNWFAELCWDKIYILI